MNQRNIVEYSPRKKREYTAYELYQREHPDWNPAQQLGGFILATLGIMTSICGFILLAQKPDLLIELAIFGGGLYAVWKLR